MPGYKGRGVIPLLLLLSTPASAADTPFARGVAALEAGRPRVARIEFMNAIQAAPDDPAPHLMQARVFLALEDGVAAEAEVRRASTLRAPAADTRHLLAEALLLAGNADGALSAAAGLSRYPAASARIRARALAMLGRTDEAERAFARAERLAPRDHRYWIDLARFRFRTGDRAAANAAAARAAALAPRDIPALVLRGVTVRDQYGLKAALPWFDRAIAVDPDNMAAWNEQAATLGDLGANRAMLAATRRVLALQPGNGQARYLQAVLAARARDWTLARVLIERSGAAASSPGGLLVAGIAALQLGNAQIAADRLGALLAAQPGNAAPRRLLGLARLRASDARGALAILAPLDTGDGADSHALTLIAAAHAQTGDAPAARFAASRATAPASGSGLFPADLGAPPAPGAAERAAGLRWDLANGRGSSGYAEAQAIQAASLGAPDAHLLAGDAAMLVGNVGAAALAYREAANIEFNQPAALRLVEALTRVGAGVEAGTALGLFLDQHPQSGPARRLLANMRLAAGDWNGAISAYDRVRRRTGDHDAALLTNLAWAHHERGDQARGLAFARAAYRVAPNNAGTGDSLGWMLLKDGRERARGAALLRDASF